MRYRVATTFVVLAMIGASCGSDGTSESPGDSEVPSSDADATTDAESETDSAATGAVVDPQAPGQARVSVDGLTFEFSEPGAVECVPDPDEFRFSFVIGDNEVTLGAGANLFGDEYLGSIEMRVASPEGEEGVTSYAPDLRANGVASLAFDGDSISYSGPVLMYPPFSGGLVDPIDVGNGTFSITCP